MRWIDLPGQALPLLVEPGGARHPLDGQWRVTCGSLEAGLKAGYAEEAFDDSGWEAVQLPHQKGVSAAADTLWYRCRFTGHAPAEGLHSLLRFGGAFYQAHAWLNGRPLGEHEGYFQPFGFDLTGRLQPGENLLAVACRFPVEAGAFKRKTAIAGVFADWDCKPYPSAVYPELPEPYEWVVPAGLWQPVELCHSGPVAVEAFNVFPRLVQPQSWGAQGWAEAAVLRVEVVLRNLEPDTQGVPVQIQVAPFNFEAGARADFSGTVELAAGESRRAAFELELERPRLWFPWTHGEPWLYRAKLWLGEAVSPAAEQVFGVREIRAEIADDGWAWCLNGRRIFPKGSNYISDFYLAQATPERLRRDIELARAANLDLLRAHAHITPPELYRLCDRLGMLVQCDFPLIWTYAYNLPEEQQARFRESVLRQAGDMVALLGSHPSIVLWSLHNEPPWTPVGDFLGSDVHEAQTNRAVDLEAAEAVRALDPTRPALPASGLHDEHLYHGWYRGKWYDNRRLRPAFPTEFGVQALPGPGSPFWETVNTDWPVDAEDDSWVHAGYQSLFWASPGVGLPDQYASLADYIAAGQAYQAFYIRYTIDQWRRQKFSPTGGYIHFMFSDCWPGITWSVLDYARQPKAGYHALAEASRPVRLALDLDEVFRVERAYQLVYPLDGLFALDMYLVNDDYRKRGNVEIRWWLEREGEQAYKRAARRIFSRRLIVIGLPEAGEGARLVKSVEVRLRHPGRYTFHTEVRQGSRRLDDNRIEFRVGNRQRARKAPRHIPRFLVRRVYIHGSLRRFEDGFSFRLHNPTLPVSVQRLRSLRVDGEALDLAQVELLCAEQARFASEISPREPFEVPSRRDVEVRVHGLALQPGRRSLEVTVALKGFGEMTAEIRDRL